MKMSFKTIFGTLLIFLCSIRICLAQETVSQDSILQDSINVWNFNPPPDPDSATRAELYHKGVNKAQEAILHDSLIIKIYTEGFVLSMPFGADEQFDRIMKNNFGIYFQVPSADTIKYHYNYKEEPIIWGAYDSVMYNAMIKKFSVDVIDTTMTYLRDRYPQPAIKGHFLSKHWPYTKEALRDSIQGVVYVRVGVPQSGIPRNPQIVKSLGHGLDKEVLQIVKKLRFVPAQKIETDTVMFHVTIPFYFRLPHNH